MIGLEMEVVTQRWEHGKQRYLMKVIQRPAIQTLEVRELILQSAVFLAKVMVLMLEHIA